MWPLSTAHDLVSEQVPYQLRRMKIKSIQRIEEELIGIGRVNGREKKRISVPDKHTHHSEFRNAPLNAFSTAESLLVLVPFRKLMPVSHNS